VNTWTIRSNLASFHVQATLIPRRTRKAVGYLLAGIPGAISGCLFHSSHEQSAAPDEVISGTLPSPSAEQDRQDWAAGNEHVLPHDRVPAREAPVESRWGLLRGKQKADVHHSSAATLAAAAAVRVGAVSEDVRAGRWTRRHICVQLFLEEYQ